MQVVLLPKTSVEFQEAPLPQAPVAAIFALITVATTLTANGVPILQSVLAGDLSLLSDPQYFSVALPGTIATFALLRTLPTSFTGTDRTGGPHRALLDWGSCEPNSIFWSPTSFTAHSQLQVSAWLCACSSILILEHGVTMHGAKLTVTVSCMQLYTRLGTGWQPRRWGQNYSHRF